MALLQPKSDEKFFTSAPGTSQDGHRTMRMLHMTINEADSIGIVRYAGNTFLSLGGGALGYCGKTAIQIADRYDAGTFQLLWGEWIRLGASVLAGAALLYFGLYLESRSQTVQKNIEDETKFKTKRKPPKQSRWPWSRG